MMHGIHQPCVRVSIGQPQRCRGFMGRMHVVVVVWMVLVWWVGGGTSGSGSGGTYSSEHVHCFITHPQSVCIQLYTKEGCDKRAGRDKLIWTQKHKQTNKQTNNQTTLQQHPQAYPPGVAPQTSAG